MQNRWTVLSALSLAFFFVTATTFTSLAVVLFTMCAKLHWSLAEAGFSFSLLGLACGLSSPLPAVVIRWIGPRWTATGGCLLMAAAFLIASVSRGIMEFFVAIILMGTAFSLVAPVPGMFLVPRWFADHAPRIVGFYFMGGSAGGVLGPILVNASVAWTENWRLHWALMAGAAVVLAVICACLVRDRSEQAVAAESAAVHAAPVPSWTTRSAMLTRPFLVTAFAMAVVQTALTVLNSSLVAHMHLLGATTSSGAMAIGLVALAGTLAKGGAAALTERIHPLQMLIASLALNGIALALFGLSRSIPLNFLAAGLFGVGWGTSWLSAHLLLLRRFGRVVTPALVGVATGITTVAVIGPSAAGLVADRTGSFSPIFLVVSGLCLVALIPAILLRREPGMSLRAKVADDGLPAGQLGRP
ncbi:CynX/NimT family MFS transporter [Lichenicoccus sp.]|uniref:MFS transporter n=1 Tax=Lichenicoccus sp. TaxID=2781899 RepID=UPI003D0ACA13